MCSSTQKEAASQATVPDSSWKHRRVRYRVVGYARDCQAAVDADQALLGLACEDAEPLPSAHLADTLGRQVRQPVVDARMRFGSQLARQCQDVCGDNPKLLVLLLHLVQFAHLGG